MSIHICLYPWVSFKFHSLLYHWNQLYGCWLGFTVMGECKKFLFPPLVHIDMKNETIFGIIKNEKTHSVFDVFIFVVHPYMKVPNPHDISTSSELPWSLIINIPFALSLNTKINNLAGYICLHIDNLFSKGRRQYISISIWLDLRYYLPKNPPPLIWTAYPLHKWITESYTKYGGYTPIFWGSIDIHSEIQKNL